MLLVLVAAALAAAARAGDEHHRWLAAELLIVAGDARRLANEPLAPSQREGLRARIAGAVSSLPLSIRRAGGRAAALGTMRSAAARDDWAALAIEAGKLQLVYPNDLGAIASAPPTPERMRLGQAIHRESCAACHDAPATGTKLPARNLFEQSAATPREEFAARLLLGVRGDRTTAYRNPFNDLELGALMVWYASGGR